MQDLVSNIGVARAGYPNMAASACIGAPLLNILLGLGVCAIAGNAFVANPYPLSLSTQLLVCLFFLLGSVALAVSFMLFYDYRADFSMGALLVSLYVVFLVVTLALDEYDTDAYGSAAAAKASVDARGGRGDFEPIST
jgi:sodium/potassium/calcium exchanger 6